MAKGCRVECWRCGGEGQIDLSPSLAEALAALRKQKGEVNGATLARKVGIKPTAMANRLAALQRLGLAVGRPNGRETLWRAP